MPNSEHLIKLGENIASKRKAIGLNQSALALRCDMDRQNMHKIEKGQVNISFLTLIKIAEALTIPVRDLVDFE